MGVVEWAAFAMVVALFGLFFTIVIVLIVSKEPIGDVTVPNPKRNYGSDEDEH